MTGYTYASIDGIAGLFYTPTPSNEINEEYLDGVSVTYEMPRKHIWSFFNGHEEIRCCNQEDLESVLSYNFIEDNYFCDTGIYTNFAYATNYPVWDGVTQCGNCANCCAPSSGPWFNTMLSFSSTSDIEVGICADEGTDNEDCPVGLIEFYVK